MSTGQPTTWDLVEQLANLPSVQIPRMVVGNVGNTTGTTDTYITSNSFKLTPSNLAPGNVFVVSYVISGNTGATGQVDAYLKLGPNGNASDTTILSLGSVSGFGYDQWINYIMTILATGASGKVCAAGTIVTTGKTSGVSTYGALNVNLSTSLYLGAVYGQGDGSFNPTVVSCYTQQLC